MRDIVAWCFLLSIAMSMISVWSPYSDFTGTIFAVMFWVSGWIIAWGRIRYAP